MVEVSPQTRLSKNFGLHEFLDMSSRDVDKITLEPLFLYLVPWLQKIRESTGVPVKITCFYRNPEDNMKAGGVADSTHLKGYAVDFSIPALYGFTTEQKKLFKTILAFDPEIRVGYYSATVKREFFIHMDCGRLYSTSTYPVWQQMK